MKIERPVSFAHVAVDWYEPVLFCATEIWPAISSGGCMIFDDYYDWGGCKKAVDEYFENRFDYKLDNSGGNLKVIKI